MEIVINIVIAFASMLGSWWVTHRYYKKSLLDQSEHWQKIEESILHAHNKDILVLYEKRVQSAIECYRKKGNPRDCIDSFNDLSLPEKAKMYDDVLLRQRGRKGKNNPYLELS